MGSDQSRDPRRPRPETPPSPRREDADPDHRQGVERRRVHRESEPGLPHFVQEPRALPARPDAPQEERSVRAPET